MPICSNFISRFDFASINFILKPILWQQMRSRCVSLLVNTKEDRYLERDKNNGIRIYSTWYVYPRKPISPTLLIYLNLLLSLSNYNVEDTTERRFRDFREIFKDRQNTRMIEHHLTLSKCAIAIRNAKKRIRQSEEEEEEEGNRSDRSFGTGPFFPP